MLPGAFMAPKKNEALDMAQLKAQIDTHEAVCAERYGYLAKMMEDSQKELKELRQVIAMGSGAWKFVLAIGAVLTIVLTNLQIFKS